MGSETENNIIKFPLRAQRREARVPPFVSADVTEQKHVTKLRLYAPGEFVRVQLATRQKWWYGIVSHPLQQDYEDARVQGIDIPIFSKPFWRVYVDLYRSVDDREQRRNKGIQRPLHIDVRPNGTLLYDWEKIKSG